MAENEVMQEQQDTTPETKTYTQEEVDKLLQSETDKRVSQALKTQEKKYAKEKSLLGLDDNQRALAERDDTIAELQAQLKGFTLEKNKSEIKTVLGNHGLPVDFADLINVSEDLDETIERVNSLEKVFKQAVQDEVKRRLAGATPNASNKGQLSSEFADMTIQQKQELYRNNPELYQMMSAQGVGSKTPKKTSRR